MTITANDIKLLASARMVDATDGGGQMTGTPLQDGAENNVWPDISSLNFTQGALQLRKVYAAVLQAGTDTYLGAHAVIDDLPDDSDVAAVLMPATTSLQTVADLAVGLNAGGEGFGFAGAAHTTAAVASGASTVPVASVRAPLIPRTVLADAVAGNLVADGAQPTVVAWVPSGQTVAMLPSGLNRLQASLPPGARLRPGSLAGSFTAPGGAGTVACRPDGQATLSATGYSRAFIYDGVQGYAEGGGSDAFAGLTDIVITAEVLVQVQLPQRTIRFPVVDGQVAYSLQLPVGTAVNSEALSYTMATPVSTGLQFASPVTNGGASAQAGRETLQATTIALYGLQQVVTGSFATVNFASIDRSTGVLQLVLPAPAKAGTTIDVTFADSSTTPLLPAALVSGGLFASGSASVTPGAGLELVGAAFSIAGGEAGLSLLGGVVRNSANTVRGSASAAGVITIPGNDGLSLTHWYAAQFDPAYGVSGIAATLPTALAPATLEITGETALGAAFTATASASGVFSTAHVTGTYDRATGALDLTFAASTKLRSLAYSATRQSPQAVFAPLWGIDPTQFADDGTVPVLRAGQIVVLRHTASVAPATYANGNTINCGRTGLADVRLVGADGVSIKTGWSANLATGLVTVADISGWAQPVTVRHAIEHMAIVLSVPNAGAVVLSRAVDREFPAGSVLASALPLGDMQARAGQAFAQESWTGVWQDTRIGAAVAAQYQQAANPITVRNDGAVTERWAIVFNTSTTFRLIGETLGQIAVGDINTTFAPANPATGQPYFTIQATGWGAWSAGNVLRFNTTGANAPIWAARVVLPSAPSTAPDSILLAIRGDIDA